MPIIRSLFRAVFALILLAGAPAARAALNVYMQVPGIKGESTSKSHPQWIDIAALSGCISNAGGTSKAGTCDINISKYVDITTPSVYGSLLTGKGTGSSKVLVDICGTNSVGAEVCYYKLQLRNVHFTSASHSLTNGDDRATESWSMAFDAISWSYTPNWATTPGTPIVQCWDFIVNNNTCP